MTTSYAAWMIRRVRHALAAVALGTIAFNSAGCIGMQPESSPAPKILAKAPTGEPRELVTYWDRSLQMAPDPTRNYQYSPCIVGRMVLLGADSNPVTCNGSAIVVLYDERPPNGGPPAALETWAIDNANLKKMISMDPALGIWGYTLALPTETCRPNIGQVRIDVQFKPEHGGPLFAPSTAMRMNYNDLISRSGMGMLANYRPAGQAMPGGQAQPNMVQASHMPQQPLTPHQAMQQFNQQQYQQALAPQQAPQQSSQQQNQQPAPQQWPMQFGQKQMQQPVAQQPIIPQTQQPIAPQQSPQQFMQQPLVPASANIAVPQPPAPQLQFQSGGQQR